MKTQTRMLALLLALTLLFSFSACSDSTQLPADTQDTVPPAENPGISEQTSDAASETVTITDHVGNTLTVPKEIRRIAVCDIYPLPSVLAVFFDSAEKIVGMAGPSMNAASNGLLAELYPEIVTAETGFIDGTTVNNEALLALEPDIVFYSADNPTLGQQLQQAGFAAIGISASKWNYDAIETLHQWLLLLGQLFPDNDRTKQVAEYSRGAYALVQSRVSGLEDDARKNIFFLFQYSPETISTSGRQFFGQWWAEAVGARNVGEMMEANKSNTVNLEQVYAWNPEQIFITNYNTAQPEDLFNNTVGTYDWSGIQAVQDQQVFKMPLGMYRSYTCGVDTPVTLYWMAKAVYPDLFSDIDITEKAEAYYRDIFGITLTDAQVQKIFAPLREASAY